MRRNIGDFGMFTTVGNRLVEDMVKEALGRKEPNCETVAFLRERMKEIDGLSHGEVYDTVVREEIVHALGREGIDIFDINEWSGS